MKTTHRNYTEEAGDFFRLSQFVLDHHNAVRRYSTWCIGRLVDWKYGLYENKRAFPAFCNQNAHLWFDAFERLAGFVISENGDTGFAILMLPGYRLLFEPMLDWVLKNWGARGDLNIEITQHQGLEARCLEASGFRKTGSFFTRAFDLTQDLPTRPPLEEGFTIVDMASYPDYEEQRRLRSNAFQGIDTISPAQMQQLLQFYNYNLQGPIYHPQTDLCVMSPEGKFVSGCEALIDAHNAEADIERVCTHSAYRQRGFARAVIQECLNRLQDLGIRRAYITGYSREAIGLYGSLGAVDEMESFTYCQERHAP